MKVKQSIIQFKNKVKQCPHVIVEHLKWSYIKQNVLHHSWLPRMGIRHIKRNARQRMRMNWKGVYLASFLRMIVLMIVFIIGFSPTYKWLDIESRLATNPNLKVPTINTPVIWGCVIAWILGVVIFDVFLTSRLLTDSKFHNSSDTKEFGFEWLSISLEMMLNRWLWACAGLIPFIVAVDLAATNNHLWYGMLVFAILLSIMAYLRSRYAYSLSVIESMDQYLDQKQSMKKSRMTMRSHKLEMFTLMLSFLGWDFANIAFCGLLSVYVVPYKLSSVIEFRKDLMLK